MQLTLIKTLFVIGTLAGVVLANNDGGYKKNHHGGGGYEIHDNNEGGYMEHHKGGYHRKGGVIKKTILIDGCTGKPFPPPTPYDDIKGGDFKGGEIKGNDIKGDNRTPAFTSGPQHQDLLNDLTDIFEDLETNSQGTVDELDDSLGEGFDDFF